ncbi:hypothetical protein LWI28_012088 [Acer negundo]|uniref:Uncharacterized protein n=1 Tax=Acer negundo TaxID=4023 RepID=A0AAD5IJ49_ACENE|nr:hypothetical protein LWI28_012088 [Acer negundo]
MVAYLAKVRGAMSRFKGVRMEQIPREKNHWVDVLAKIAAGEGHTLPRGTEVVLPIKHKLISFWIQNYEPEDNEAKLRANLELLEEKQSKFVEILAVYQSPLHDSSIILLASLVGVYPPLRSLVLKWPKLPTRTDNFVIIESPQDQEIALWRSCCLGRGVPSFKKIMIYQTKDPDS